MELEERLNKVIDTAFSINNLSRTQMLTIKRFNIILKKQQKDKYFKFPFGSIVARKTSGYLRRAGNRSADDTFFSGELCRNHYPVGKGIFKERYCEFKLIE